MVAVWIEAHSNSDYAAVTRLEKLVPLERFAKFLTQEGSLMSLPSWAHHRIARVLICQAVAGRKEKLR